MFDIRETLKVLIHNFKSTRRIERKKKTRTMQSMLRSNDILVGCHNDSHGPIVFVWHFKLSFIIFQVRQRIQRFFFWRVCVCVFFSPFICHFHSCLLYFFIICSWLWALKALEFWVWLEYGFGFISSMFWCSDWVCLVYVFLSFKRLFI